jgi:hypothetical protein
MRFSASIASITFQGPAIHLTALIARVQALPYLALHFSTMLELTKRHRICHDEPIAKLGCVLAMRIYELVSRLLYVPSCDVISLNTRSKCS